MYKENVVVVIFFSPHLTTIAIVSISASASTLSYPKVGPRKLHCLLGP